MGITFLQLAEKILKEEDQPLSPNEIWELALVRGYSTLVGSSGKTPWASLGALLYLDVRDNPSSLFQVTGERPKRFYLGNRKDELNFTLPPEEKNVKTFRTEKDYSEKDLHPLLVYFGHVFLDSHLLTINHTKSDHRVFSEWIHPDLVGCHFPFKEWTEPILELSSSMGISGLKLYSFELKKELSFSNIRESFFQAVSNSSWANEGFLVAAKIRKDPDFSAELERLSTSFGIGVIELDVSDPDSSKVILAARTRESIDWIMANKLASVNSDFQGFLKRVKLDYSVREVREQAYDKIPSKQDLIKVFE